MSSEEIGALIKSCRQDKALSQQELAQLAKVPQGHLSCIERGKANIKLETALRIFTVLELEIKKAGK